MPIDVTRLPQDPTAARMVLQAAARLESRVRAARLAFTDFVTFATMDERGEPFRLEPLHVAWHRHVAWCWSHNKFAGLWAPWGHGKSAGLVVPLTAWLIGTNPNLRVKIVCSGKELAYERVGAIKNLIESPAYKEVFPSAKPGGRWTSDELTLQRDAGHSDPTVQAKGIFSKGVGKRADVLIFDDVVDQLNAATPEQRLKVKEFIGRTWMGRLTQQGKVLYISTPWNIDDASHELVKRPQWCFLVQEVRDDREPWYIAQRVYNADATYPR